MANISISIHFLFLIFQESKPLISFSPSPIPPKTLLFLFLLLHHFLVFLFDHISSCLPPESHLSLQGPSSLTAATRLSFMGLTIAADVFPLSPINCPPLLRCPLSLSTPLLDGFDAPFYYFLVPRNFKLSDFDFGKFGNY